MITKAELVGTEYLTRDLVCSDCGNKKKLRLLPKIHEDAWTFCLECGEEIHFSVVEEDGDYQVKEMNYGD